jgi:hypothetical protein
LNEKTGREGKPVKIPEQTETAEQCGCHTIQVYRVSKEYVREGLGRVLNRKKREKPLVPAKVTGAIEAKIIAVSCGGPPPGYSLRTLRLLEERSTVLGIELSDTAIGTVLKKTPLKPHLVDCWCIAPEENAAFAANMEDVLEVYHRPYDARRPVICMDEQLLGEKREPERMTEQHNRREDAE